MHICYLCSEYPPAPHGGIGSFIQTLGRELVKKGHQVSVIGMYAAHSGEEKDEGVRVIRIPSYGPPLVRVIPNRLRFIKAFENLARNCPIDIIEGSEVSLAMAHSRVTGRKVLRMHGGPAFFGLPGRRGAMAERRSFRIADELCAVSHCVADGTRAVLKLGSRRVEVIPNPINLDLFTPPKNNTEETGLIVFTGTITERKGIRELIQAMPRIVAEVPEAHLEVYGGEPFDGSVSVPFTKTLQDSLPPDIARKVAWKGRVTREILPEVLRKAAVCVYPSRIEAMPIAWLEGLATGKAVVASKTGPGPEVIDDGVTGLLCDPFDPDSIATQVIRVLKDAALRRRLGCAARRIAEQRYALPPLVDRNIEYYERIRAR